nr:MAG TPA: hypothetical protein [Siphoviridae sp. ctRJB2]DAM29843.1 MAG TPA: hypothetical protein [Caudoviricetes sp.]DAM94729.1 MAG TPA: hypothetical protein [Bacteriophage sp.]
MPSFCLNKDKRYDKIMLEYSSFYVGKIKY